MQSQKIYDIIFEGRDYSPISQALKNMVIRDKYCEYIINSVGEITAKESEADIHDENSCWKILSVFLKDIAPNGICNPPDLFVNTSGRDYSKKKLYDLNFGKMRNLENGEESQNPQKDENSEYSKNYGYFCGVIGVVKKRMSMEFEAGTEYIFNITLQIKSRLDIGSDNSGSKPFFLSTLLLSKKEIQMNDNTVPNSEEEIFDYLLLFWFKEHMLNALLKGYFKSYVRFQENNDRLKGNIDIARHIKMNMGQKNGKIAYSYRENTINNPLNQLIVRAYSHLEKKYPHLMRNHFDNHIDLKRGIDFLRSEIDSFKLKNHSLINRNIKSISHPYFGEYEKLRKLCIKILRDESVGLFDGNINQEANGILFYLPDLWEIFLENEMRSYLLVENEIGMDSQRNFKYFESKGEGKKGKYYRETARPDFVFYYLENNNDKEKIFFMILDAKFKPKWEGIFEDNRIDGIEEDYNKCLRDMIVINSHATGVIFPADKYQDEINQEIWKNPISKYNRFDMFYTIPIQIPRAVSDEKYCDWNRKFKDRLKSSMKILNDILMEEKKYSQKIRKLDEDMKRD